MTVQADGPARPYMNPYLAGVGLGLVLLSSFIVMGRGLGASGGFTSMVAAGVQRVAPEHARSNGLLGHHLTRGNPLRDWLVFELMGVFLGGALSSGGSGYEAAPAFLQPSGSPSRRWMVMIAPFYELGFFGDGWSLVVAVIIGMGFGWFLERGGMGNARKLAAQFYLTDMTVFKMLFTAVVTAMLGIFWLGTIGFLETALLYVPPTWFLPQLAGGVVFGVGFVMGGLCPGTSCVAVSSGRLDGVALLFGLLVGILAVGEAFPRIEAFYHSTSAGTLTLPGLLHVSYPVIVAAVAAMAVALFLVAEWVERRSG